MGTNLHAKSLKFQEQNLAVQMPAICTRSMTRVNKKKSPHKDIDALVRYQPDNMLNIIRTKDW